MNFKHLYYQKKLCFLHKMLRSDNSIVASVMKFLYTVTGPDLAGGGLGPSHRHRRRGERGLPSPTIPPKNPRKYFLRANNVKFGHFPDKCHVKFGHFVNFFIHNFWLNVLPPPNLTHLLPYAYGPVLPVARQICANFW